VLHSMSKCTSFRYGIWIGVVLFGFAIVGVILSAWGKNSCRSTDSVRIYADCEGCVSAWKVFRYIDAPGTSTALPWDSRHVVQQCGRLGVRRLDANASFVCLAQPNGMILTKVSSVTTEQWYVVPQRWYSESNNIAQDIEYSINQHPKKWHWMFRERLFASSTFSCRHRLFYSWSAVLWRLGHVVIMVWCLPSTWKTHGALVWLAYVGIVEWLRWAVCSHSSVVCDFTIYIVWMYEVLLCAWVLHRSLQITPHYDSLESNFDVVWITVAHDILLHITSCFWFTIAVWFISPSMAILHFLVSIVWITSCLLWSMSARHHNMRRTM
jgi:hypothetical protein